MVNNMNIITIDIPEYTVDIEPDHRNIGKKVDDVLREHFMGQTVLLRALGTIDHKDKSVDELVDIIKTTGTDKYDPERIGDRYPNIEGKQFDLCALTRTISIHSKIFWQLSWSFYSSPLKVRGYPVRVDIIIVYDPKKLKAVFYTPLEKKKLMRDGFVFRDKNNKPGAILGIIILR